MTKTYETILKLAESNETTFKDFETALWKYVENTLEAHFADDYHKDSKIFFKILFSKKITNPFGARALVLDDCYMRDLYNDIAMAIWDYAVFHKLEECSSDAEMRYYKARMEEIDAVDKEIHNNPLIKNLFDHDHGALARKVARYALYEDERVIAAEKQKKSAMHEMRAERFFEILRKVLEKGE